MHDYSYNPEKTTSQQEAIALLKYMVHHNQHHTLELHELSHQFDENVGKLLHDAVDKYDDGNKLLTEALKLIEEGK